MTQLNLRSVLASLALTCNSDCSISDHWHRPLVAPGSLFLILSITESSIDTLRSTPTLPPPIGPCYCELVPHLSTYFFLLHHLPVLSSSFLVTFLFLNTLFCPSSNTYQHIFSLPLAPVLFSLPDHLRIHHSPSPSLLALICPPAFRYHVDSDQEAQDRCHDQWR